MTTLVVVVGAFLIGVIGGLRVFSALAVTSWGAHLGGFSVAGTPLAFLGSGITAWILSVLVIGEFAFDQVPGVPTRKTPMQFTARIAAGAVCGAVLGTSRGAWLIGLVAGVAGAIVGTLGGYDIRMRLAKAFGRDRPAAALEDAVALVGAILIVAVFA